MQLKNTNYALRTANPRAANRPAGGWPPAGRIVMWSDGQVNVSRCCVRTSTQRATTGLKMIVHGLPTSFDPKILVFFLFHIFSWFQSNAIEIILDSQKKLV
jgi:hypothetical protein